jgi:lysophospholipase L1-like esterase
MSIRPEAAKAATKLIRLLPKDNPDAWPALIEVEIVNVAPEYRVAVREVARLEHRRRVTLISRKRKP